MHFVHASGLVNGSVCMDFGYGSYGDETSKTVVPIISALLSVKIGTDCSGSEGGGGAQSVRIFRA